ncbi:polyketide cyclase [Mycobacterium asiaticum]|uniref:Polyketide cyclase n=1 Tax=Mycobacterium asiaticum TaxID=1790 RepID=A0A1A3NPN5_MYCAS|nr:SRPBCC family protein [Mycobacterium asiaticum]OBK24083.1 polyketide cyclase [Mycobacterium asiaticum]
MASPLLQTSIDIEAPPSAVWALISDLQRMPEWSPQCRWMKQFGPLRAGTRTVNVNRRNRLFWPTTSTIVEVIPEQRLAFRVDTNRTIWSYELEAHGEGTRLTESRHAENGVSAFSSVSVKAFLGGNTNFEKEMVEGMNTSLTRIKAAAEENAKKS